VKFNIDTGTLDPDTTPFYQSKKNNFQPRVGATYSPTQQERDPRPALGSSWVLARRKDQIQPIEAERISTTVT
jgi:hypothetical protein